MAPDLLDKFLIVVRAELSHFGLTTFTGYDDTELIALIISVKSKQIPARAYLVKESNFMLSQLSSLEVIYKNAYSDIKQKLIAGLDVGPYLSKQSLNPKFNDYLFLD